ncbi:MAG: translation initiation factor IF-1 [bacterium]|nr:translation initiation factor IF-1 [bacterium]
MANAEQSKEKRLGTVIEALPNTLFRIELKEGGRLMLGYLSGKMRLHRIRVLVGDTVEIEIDPYNVEKGKITRRQ